jgi:uncharacterized protein (TIGR04255 family)
MVERELYLNPTVKQVIFQIRYPNLFSLDSKMGDFQTRIFARFPQAALLYRRHLMVADLGPGAKIDDLKSEEQTGKVFQFTSATKYVLSVQSNSLDITSEYHKSYDMDGTKSFRHEIEFVLGNFFELFPLPFINRIGLRYIDHCPLSEFNNRALLDNYDSALPVRRFSLQDCDEMMINVVVRKGDYRLRYHEAVHTQEERKFLMLDFDAFAVDILPVRCLEVTDALHMLIWQEYCNTMGEAIREFMRQPGGHGNG